jgi:hypothetical protein
MSGMYSKLAKLTTTTEEPVVVDNVTEPSVEVDKQKHTDSTPSLHQSISASAFGVVANNDLIVAIHKSMRDPGSTLGSYRVSPMEKKRLEVTVFELKNRSIASPGVEDLRINENDIIRIALNYILNDYKANADDSMLVKALLSLRA